ncbi:MAG: hypothetical protein ACXACF_12075 [Candidatus Hermodarchaeia archaeon]
MKARYRVHRFDIKMTKDQSKLEQFLNSLDGEVVAIIPNVTPRMTPGGMGAEVDFLLIGMGAEVDFLLIVENVS